MWVSYDREKGVTCVDKTEFYVFCAFYELTEKKAAVLGIKDEGCVHSTPIDQNFKFGERPAKADHALVDLACSLCG
jgi:hypothetical protein